MHQEAEESFKKASFLNRMIPSGVLLLLFFRVFFFFLRMFVFVSFCFYSET